jgi:hypothetical protein
VCKIPMYSHFTKHPEDASGNKCQRDHPPTEE